MKKNPAVFFDIGDTLGAVMEESSPSRRLRLILFPEIREILETLQRKGYRIGIISNTQDMQASAVNAMLEEAGILPFFEPALCIYSSVVKKTKNSPAIFKLAARKAGLHATPARCLFVGENSSERTFALTAGWKVAPAASLVCDVLDGQRLLFLRFHVPSQHDQSAWREVLRGQQLPLAPLHVTGPGGRDIYAITSSRAAASLDNLGFGVDRLGPPGAPDTDDLYLLRDDRQTRTGFLVAEGQSEMLLEDQADGPQVVSSTSEGLFVILSGLRNIDEFHFKETRHGHTLKLLPSPSLLLKPLPSEPRFRALAPTVSIAVAERDLKPEEINIFTEINSAMIQGLVDRYSGAQSIGRGKTIRSRHVHHRNNALAVRTLEKDLRRMGGGRYTVVTQPFEGWSVKNVAAEFPGETSELVLITAHLDSTAQSEDKYRPKVHPAPGADDDASGIAAVLAAASIFPKLAQGITPRRTIRFVLFNAEEVGMIGSQRYAESQAAQRAPIMAVFQLDMVGFPPEGSVSPRPFEIHFDCPSNPDVIERSRVLARRIARIALRVSPKLQPPQIYDRNDPAVDRSDHSSFHKRDYPAVCVSEDLFVAPPSSQPTRDMNNPHYHTWSDQTIVADYAAEVARAVAAAAWLTAQP
jgi:leucyl aminopeptidase